MAIDQIDEEDRSAEDVAGPDLGQMEPVPVRDIWAHEANDFTPWLARHLTQLGESLRMQGLQLVAMEHPVGSFALDILAMDLAGRTVMIENQLETSDHDHLGKCLTYAAGVGAQDIVWITTKLREEHRAAIDWLNEHTDSDVRAFGVELQVVRIDDSRPAVVFDVTARPNDWQRSTKAAASGSRVANIGEFLTLMETNCGEESRRIAEQIIDECARRGALIDFMPGNSCVLMWPTHSRTGSPTVQSAIWPFVIYATSTQRCLHGSIEIVFQHLAKRPPFSAEDLRAEYRDRINKIPGIQPERLPDDCLGLRPNIDLHSVATPESMNVLTATLDWFLERLAEARGGFEVVDPP